MCRKGATVSPPAPGVLACLHVTYIKKITASVRASQWGPWTPANFQSEGARDQFLDTVAKTDDCGWNAEAMPHDAKSAQVRWLPGKFLRLNDLAYSHGGRINGLAQVKNQR